MATLRNLQSAHSHDHDSVLGPTGSHCSPRPRRRAYVAPRTCTTASGLHDCARCGRWAADPRTTSVACSFRVALTEPPLPTFSIHSRPCETHTGPRHPPASRSADSHRRTPATARSRRLGHVHRDRRLLASSQADLTSSRAETGTKRRRTEIYRCY
ncbi:hypothetical protein OBBRIDRAFT_656121 [Obba rivulosa]|uniref:Uncharacterized protein n=1 Tax=Obba rivulosa TaxID=1052685 RepID=A0A8E2ARE5_9APHY|nr:hypothetical protein OBBRIDRAFT_656121 [Obba rivulosa]